MAKFNGEVTFKVTFKDLGVPVGFGTVSYTHLTLPTTD